MGFWSKLGRIASFAAPIVAAPFTGGATLALIGAGAGAAGGALSGGGLKGTLLGAGLGAATAGIGGGAGGAAAGKAGHVGLGAVNSTVDRLMGAGGPSVWGRLAGLAKNPNVLGAAGAALSGAAQASASNRGTQIEAQLAQEAMRRQQERDYVDAVLAREQEGRASATDALKKIQQAEYIANATGYKPAADLTSYGFGPKASTETERTGVAGLRGELMKRLTDGNPIPEIERPQPFTIDPKHLKGSAWERIAGLLGPGLSIYGTLAQQRANT